MNIKKISKDDQKTFVCSTNYLEFDDLQSIRDEIRNFLSNHVEDKNHIGAVLLTATEILSNIIKHQEKPSNYVRVTLKVKDEYIERDIADNGSPFLGFRRKLDESMVLSGNVEDGIEAGFGFGLMLKNNDSLEYFEKQDEIDGLNHFVAKRMFKEQSHKRRTLQKIFLIDDEPIALQIHALMLKDSYEVISFEGGQQAIDAFVQHRPDLIISDLVMPGMGGIELRKRLSRLEGGDVTPFVFLSGNQYEENSLYISSLGIDDFLSKPISEAKLKTVIARLLKRSKQIKKAVQGQFSRDITELLKPSIPDKRQGWSFKIKYQIADSGGGDFVLHKNLDDSFIAILADVMGHDLQAKFFTYAYVGYLRSLFKNSPEIVDGDIFLGHLSDAVGNDPILENIIMTCQYFRIFPDGTIHISSAGHPKPLMIRANCSDANIINTAGPLPGLSLENKYKITSEKLNPGDKILFMTDGFIDVFEQTGLAAETLVEIIKNTHEQYKDGFDEYLWKSFIARQEASSFNKDDATIIIAEYGAEQ